MKVLETIRKSIRYYFATIDKWLLLFCLILSSTSVIFLYGLTGTGYAGMNQVYTQIIATVIGLCAALLISLVDYQWLVNMWKILLPLCIILIGLTYFVGIDRGSNRAWLGISLGSRSFTIQPAEFLKFVFILTFSKHINHVKDAINRLDNIVMLGLHGLFYVGIIMVMQKDAGTALVFLGMFLVMIFMAEISWGYIAAAIGALVPLIPLVWMFLMSEDQKIRFRVMRDPSISDRYSFQQLQGLKALGLGGTTGVGFGGKHVFVPEHYNDFIFTYIGQVAGLIGLLTLMIVLVILMGRLLQTAHTARDEIGRMICIGVMSMVLIQCVMNIGMCINILPVIGVTLPFVSAGGSSVLSMYMGMGLAQSVYRHRQAELFGPML